MPRKEFEAMCEQLTSESMTPEDDQELLMLNLAFDRMLGNLTDYQRGQYVRMCFARAHESLQAN